MSQNLGWKWEVSDTCLYEAATFVERGGWCAQVARAGSRYLPWLCLSVASSWVSSGEDCLWAPGSALPIDREMEVPGNLCISPQGTLYQWLSREVWKSSPLASGQDNSELYHILQRPLPDTSEVTLRGTLPEITSSSDFLLSLPASPLSCRSPLGGFLNEPLTQEPLSQDLLLRSPLRRYLTRVRDGNHFQQGVQQSSPQDSMSTY